MRRLLLMAAAAALFASHPAWSDVTETITAKESIKAGSGDRVAVHNLVGTVTIEGARGGAVDIDARFVGTGDDAKEAKAMAAKLSFEIEKTGSTTHVWVNYPTDEYRHFTYRPEGRWGNSNSQVRYRGKRVSVTSRSGGAEVYADITVRVPRGVNLFFENKVGDITASKVVGDLELDTASGRIKSSGGEGRLSADTGSGSVGVSNRKGDIDVDTGSGAVDVEDVVGDVSVDTGSGSVDLNNIRSDEINIDTGSGGVEINNASGSLYVDTGSGAVRATEFDAGKDLEIDTGSGGARIEGALGAVRRLRIDTGSGSVTLRTSDGLNMRLEVSAGSGGVRVDLPDTQVISSERGELEVDLGDGSGDGVIDTGSGGVRITSQR
ncbi:MAG: DUF4097 family beta strand repeat-containing protein [Gammaproteobacteria bacterium]